MNNELLEIAKITIEGVLVIAFWALRQSFASLKDEIKHERELFQVKHDVNERDIARLEKEIDKIRERDSLHGGKLAKA